MLCVLRRGGCGGRVSARVWGALLGMPPQRGVSSGAQSAVADRPLAGSGLRLLALNDLQRVPGSVRERRRVGRGVGSSKGKTAGRGHKGQGQRRRKMGPYTSFEGGQSPLTRRLPKFGFRNPHKTERTWVTMDALRDWIAMGRLPTATDDANNGVSPRQLTARDLQEAGLVSSVPAGGVKLLGGKLKDTVVDIGAPVHLEVSWASKGAIEAVERAGGTVTCVHLGRVALRALMAPHKFIHAPLPKRSRPPPKFMEYYASYENRGYLSPQVQERNRKLFDGAVTSEERLREEHAYEYLGLNSSAEYGHKPILNPIIPKDMRRRAIERALEREREDDEARNAVIQSKLDRRVHYRLG